MKHTTDGINRSSISSIAAGYLKSAHYTLPIKPRFIRRLIDQRPRIAQTRRLRVQS